jgi:hypothetical protein
LAKTFLWRTYDASWFVLCGYHTPPVLTLSIESNVTRYQSGPEIGTITLTVDPWLPAETVAMLYEKTQREMLRKKPHQASRHRLRLLEFVETMGEGLSWSERMGLWNEFHPDKQYKDRGNFSKACREVRSQVLSPGYTAVEKDEQSARERASPRYKTQTATHRTRLEGDTKIGA